LGDCKVETIVGEALKDAGYGGIWGVGKCAMPAAGAGHPSERRLERSRRHSLARTNASCLDEQLGEAVLSALRRRTSTHTP